MAEYTFSGNVIRGNQRGRDLGFPTANIKLSLVIPEGIYASQVIFNDHTYHALTFIGKAETFNESVYQSETYILDFSGDLYGKTLHVSLLKKLRGSEKFIDVPTLVMQMKQDEKDAREFFSHVRD